MNSDKRSSTPTDKAGAGLVTPDPDRLVHALETSGRFRRDTTLGAIFHRRKVSFREVCRNRSLHIVVDGHEVSAHVDQVSPLNCDPDSSAHYSVAHVVVHNLSGICADMARRVRGRRGHHRFDLQSVAAHLDDEAITELLAEPEPTPGAAPTEQAS